jgi:hypothetical protein
MITTISTKQQQLSKGTFSIGSGPEIILIMGSCRTVPYVNYFNFINEKNRFTIHFIDPFNWNWNLHNDRVDHLAELKKQETNEYLLDVLKNTKIFIHEYYENAGMFNVSKKSENNIYNYGLKPQIDICIPNFNDVFILTADLCRFDTSIRSKAIQDYNVTGKLSEQTLADIREKGKANLQKFYDVCDLTMSLSFKEWFQSNYKKKRLWFTYNHVSNAFTSWLFYFMMAEYLDSMIVTREMMIRIDELNMYADTFTSLTEYDLGYEWGEPIKPLREIIF